MSIKTNLPDTAKNNSFASNKKGKFFSTKKFGPISTTHRQWRHTGHCKYLHGYARTVQLIFTCNKLDEMGFCVDFGSLKQVKEWLYQQWDHKCLLSHDDPLLEEFKTYKDSKKHL